MEGLIRLDDKIYVLTRAPNEADLKQLSSSGVRTVVNLRAPGESGEVLAPDAEGEKAKENGLAYLSAPITPADLNPKTVSTIGAELEKLPEPVAIHCASGKRASLMALSHWARQHHASAREAATKAQAAGLNVSEADLQPLLD